MTGNGHYLLYIYFEAERAFCSMIFTPKFSLAS